MSDSSTHLNPMFLPYRNSQWMSSADQRANFYIKKALTSNWLKLKMKKEYFNANV